MKPELFIPLAGRSKKPLAGEDWHNRLTSFEEAVRSGGNVGLPLAENGLSAVDWDTGLEPARAFARAHPELCKVLSRTFRGIHALFAGTTATRKFKHGDIKGNGYIVIPPSTVWQKEEACLHTYRWLREDWDHLPTFPEELFPGLRTSERASRAVPQEIRDAQRYIRGIRAVSGSGGHNATFRVACILRDAGLDEASALAEMMEWNQTNAEPPWGAKELLHKVRDAFRKVMQ